MRLVRNRFELRPNRIAGHDRTLSEIRGSTRIGDGSEVHPSPQHAVGKAGDGVLLHDDSRISVQNRRAQHGKRRIAADTDHDCRTKFLQYFLCPQDAFHRCRKVSKPRTPPDTFHASRRQTAQRKPFLRHQPGFDSLLCANKKNFGILASALDFARYRDPRKEMSACSTACNDCSHSSQIRGNRN